MEMNCLSCSVNKQVSQKDLSINFGPPSSIKLEHNESSPKVNVREVLNATHCVGSAETIRPTVLNITQGGADFIRFGLVHEEAHFVAFYTSMHSILLRRDR